MSEDAEAIVSAATPEVQAEAERMGWIPPVRFKGEADRFMDAEAYLERGRTVLPIVTKALDTTRNELAAMRTASVEQTRLIKQLTDAREEDEMRHTVEKQKAVEKAREDLKADLAAASEAGDHKAVAEFTAALTDNAAELKDLKAEPPVKKDETPPPAAEDPTFLAWKNENPWFSVDRRKTALALGIAEDLRAGGERSTGRTFFEKVGVELAVMLGTKAPSGDKVEGARNGSGEGGGAKGSYAKLPADARAACDSEAKRFVGPGKKFKTNAEWQGHYATIYFKE